MKMTSITIRNIACFEDATFPLGSIVLIQGKNASGKSTLLKCVTYAFGRGHDPDFLRGGTEEGEVVILFDEGTQVRARVLKDKTERMVKPAGVKRWDKSREFIDAVSNALSYDPLAFLEKSDREQVSEVLRIMPVDVDAAEMAAALEPLPDKDMIEQLDLAGRSPLEVINTIRQAVYDTRTRVHVAADTHEKHAHELALALQNMTVDGTDWSAEVGRLQVQLAGIDSAQERLHDDLTGRLKLFISDQQGKRDKLMLIKEQEVDAQIAKLKADLASYGQECIDSCNKGIDDAKSIARQNLDTFTSQQVDERARLQTSLAQAEQSYKIALNSKSTQDTLAAAKEQALVARTKQKAMTDTLERIDALKAAVAARLPLPCTIADGRLCNSEMVPLSKWNQASKYAFVLKLGVMAHGAAGFICVDSHGFDAFDPEHRRAFMAAMAKYVKEDGLQFVVCSVTDGDLQVLEAME